MFAVSRSVCDRVRRAQATRRRCGQAAGTGHARRSVARLPARGRPGAPWRRPGPPCWAIARALAPGAVGGAGISADGNSSATRTGCRGARADGRVERLLEGRGVAGDEGEADPVPIRAGPVLHHRPPLQPRLPLPRGHDQAPGGFPERRGGDVADRDLPRRRGAGQPHLHHAAVGGAGGGQGFGGAAEAAGEVRVGESDGIAIGQRQAAQALFRHQREAQRGGGVRRLHLLRIHQAARGARGLHRLAAQRAQQGGAVGEILGLQGQAAEGFRQQVLRGQAHAFDAAGGVAHQQGFQDIVHILHRNAEG